MKKILLIILILMGACSYGQDSVQFYFTEKDSLYWETPQHYAVNQTIDKLLDYYDQYALECYNDSTLTEVPYQCDRIGCLVFHPPVKKWIHSQPTFQGFINYLKNRKDGFK